MESWTKDAIRRYAEKDFVGYFNDIFESQILKSVRKKEKFHNYHTGEDEDLSWAYKIEVHTAVGTFKLIDLLDLKTLMAQGSNLSNIDQIKKEVVSKSIEDIENKIIDKLQKNNLQ